MPIDIDTLNKKIRFYNLLYRAALMTLALTTFILIVVGVRQVFIISHRLDERTMEINQHINCELSLFTQPNRTNLTIDDIQNCTLVRK